MIFTIEQHDCCYHIIDADEKGVYIDPDEMPFSEVT